MEKVNLAEKFDSFDEQWSPKIVGELNGQCVKIVKVKGEFVWHHHDEEDELFLCWDGTFRVEVIGAEPVTLTPGDVFVVPARVEHRPVAASPAHAVLLERPETLQYGN